MIDYHFVQSLYHIAIQQGSCQFLIDARDNALNKVISGNDSTYTSMTEGGHTITSRPGMTTMDLVTHLNKAIHYYTYGPEGSFGIDYTMGGV